ncbi:MAG: ANTAR domain-containing response regulator [Magnetovibrionaceae bacterium]
MTGQYRVLVIDESDERAAILIAGLRDVEHREIIRLRDMSNLVERISEIDPDVILIDLENPNRDTVEQMFHVSQIVKRPIAIFVDQSDQATTRRAICAGISAYVVNGLAEDRIKPIIDTAVSRFEAYRDLEDRALMAEQALDERKVIDRAKGILMKRNQLSESDAYAMLRNTARDKGRRMADIAKSVVLAAEIGV